MLYFDQNIMISKPEVLIRSFIGLIILDVVSLLYIYSTIISAPAFLVTMIDMFNLHSTISRLNIYKVFPWIGLYMHPLDGRNPNTYFISSLSSSSKYVSRAILGFFFFIYFVYLGSMLFLSRLLFLNYTHSSLT